MHCPLILGARDQFVQLAHAYAAFNPHLTLRCRWDHIDISVAATDPNWSKWKTSDPTSAHWYNYDTFERYAASHVACDQERGYRWRTVRDFIKELRGLRRADAQKLVLEETKSARVLLSDYFSRGSDAMIQLLDSCCSHTEPVKPALLGLIGKDHLLRYCVGYGAAEESFEYRKHRGENSDGMPYALEVAYGYCPKGSNLKIISGINFSIAIGNPFRRLGSYGTLLETLSGQEIDYDDPFVFVMHYVSPVVEFSDHGKTAVTLPRDVGDKAYDLIVSITKDWAREIRAEIREENARDNFEKKLLKAKTKRVKREPPEPTGVLGEKISAVADELGVPIDSLIVQSSNGDPYTAWRRRPNAERFVELFHRFVAPGAKKHLRGLFYRCVMTKDVIKWSSGKILVNNPSNWAAFLKASSDARWLGLIPFSSIIDERNAEARIYVPPEEPISADVTPAEDCAIPLGADNAMPDFSLDGFRGRQTHRIIFYGEKTSLAEVLDPIAIEIGADMVLVTGESSHTRLAEAIERANKDGRPVVLCYFADFDPAGHQMTISVARKT